MQKGLNELLRHRIQMLVITTAKVNTQKTNLGLGRLDFCFYYH